MIQKSILQKYVNNPFKWSLNKREYYSNLKTTSSISKSKDKSESERSYWNQGNKK